MFKFQTQSSSCLTFSGVGWSLIRTDMDLIGQQAFIWLFPLCLLSPTAISSILFLKSACKTVTFTFQDYFSLRIASFASSMVFRSTHHVNKPRLFSVSGSILLARLWSSWIPSSTTFQRFPSISTSSSRNPKMLKDIH